METIHHEEHPEDMAREEEIQGLKAQGEDDHMMLTHKDRSKEVLH